MSSTGTGDAARTSWLRANKLVELTNLGDSFAARGFLSKHPNGDLYKQFLDAEVDTRTKEFKGMKEEYQQFISSSPSQPPKPRNGRVRRKQVRRNQRQVAKTLNHGEVTGEIIGELTRLVEYADIDSINLKDLYELSDISKRVGGLGNAAFALGLLSKLS